MSVVNAERYAAYKDTDVEWLREVPMHWEVVRIKNIAKTQSGTTPRSDVNGYYENGEINWIRTTDLNNGHLSESEYKVTTHAVRVCGLKYIPINSILLAMYGGMGTIGKNALLIKSATINQSVCAILPHPKRFISSYLWYYTQYFRPHWELFADSARKDPNINQEAVKRLWVVLPPLPEQTTIAAYLDSKTAQIDRKIDLLTQKATQYEKLKQSLINETVTRGLDKSVSMKDSDVAWIGEIPEHWEVKRVKELGSLVLGKMLDNTPNPKKMFKPYLKSKNIGWLKLANKNIEEMYFSPYEMSLYRIKKDDLLFSEGGEVGKTSIWNDEIPECYLQNSVHKFTANKNNNSRYLLYLSFSAGQAKYYDSIVNHVSIKHLTKEKLSRVEWLSPPLSEQIAIAAYLDEKTTQIDDIVTAINAQIDKLQDLRKVLINDVVTGKIKVVSEGAAE